MVKLIKSLNYWGTDNFSSILKMELLELGVNSLPLDKAATAGKFINNSDIGIIILSISKNEENIKAIIGIMFTETQWAYCCGEEEPMTSNAYCELEITINKLTANTIFIVL